MNKLNKTLLVVMAGLLTLALTVPAALAKGHGHAGHGKGHSMGHGKKHHPKKQHAKHQPNHKHKPHHAAAKGNKSKNKNRHHHHHNHRHGRGGVGIGIGVGGVGGWDNGDYGDADNGDVADVTGDPDPVSHPAAVNAAARMLAVIKDLIRANKLGMARARLNQLIQTYPNTPAADEAAEILTNLE